MRLVNGLDGEATALLIEALAACGADGRPSLIGKPRAGAQSVSILATRVRRNGRFRKVELFQAIGSSLDREAEHVEPSALAEAIVQAERKSDWSAAASTIGRRGAAARHLEDILEGNWLKASMTIGAPGLAPAIRADLADGTRTVFVAAAVAAGRSGDVRVLPEDVVRALTEDALHLRTPDPTSRDLAVHLGSAPPDGFERPDAIELLRMLRAARRRSDG